jgi:hypothetical protein
MRVEVQLRLLLKRVEAQDARIAALEARPARRKRAPVQRPDDAEVAETIRRWNEYHGLAEEAYGKASRRASKAGFARRHHIPYREFCRGLSLNEQNPLGPVTRARSEALIIEATATLKNAAKQPRGSRQESPLSRLKPAV